MSADVSGDREEAPPSDQHSWNHGDIPRLSILGAMPPPTSSSSPPASRLKTLFAIGTAAVLALLFHRWIASDFAEGLAHWDAWRHRPEGGWQWRPYIHPPPYDRYLRFIEGLANSAGTGPVDAHLRISGWLSAATVLAAGLWFRRLLGASGLLFAGLAMMVLSPALLRPFEQYPLVTLLLTATSLLLFEFLHGGKIAALLGGLTLGFLAIGFHLSSWFLLGPLLVGGTIWLPKRRTPLVLGTLGLLGLFGIFTLWPGPGLWVIFDTPHVFLDDERPDQMFVWSDASIEWTNPFLLLAPFAWLFWPHLRRCSPSGAVLAFALASYSLITWTLMASGLAITDTRETAHHYMELAEPGLVLLGLLTCKILLVGGAGVREKKSGRGLVATLVITQLALGVAGVTTLRTIAQSPWDWLDFHSVASFGQTDPSPGTSDGWIDVRHDSDPDGIAIGRGAQLRLTLHIEGQESQTFEEDLRNYHREYPVLGFEFGGALLPIRYRLEASLEGARGEGLIGEVSSGDWVELRPGAIDRIRLPSFDTLIQDGDER